MQMCDQLRRDQSLRMQ